MRVPPFHPFRDGPPLFLPRLRPIDAAKWLNPDTEAEVWLADKHALMRKERDAVFASLADTEAAQAECLALVQASVSASTLPRPFPTALERAASLVSDDIALLRRSETDGQWRLCAASLCAPTFWRLSEGLGKPLGGLHRPVPSGDPVLAGRISRIFDNLPPDQVLERFNWTVQVSNQRFTPTQVPLKHLAQQTPVADAESLLHLRVERQTIRRLPHSGAMIFTIRICVDPLIAALQTFEDLAAFAAAWRSLGADERDYKGWPAYEAHVSALLASLHKRTLH